MLEIEHIVPTARGGTDAENNLWLACRLCNGYKGTQIHGTDPMTGRRIRLFNRYGEKLYPALSLITAARYFDADIRPLNGSMLCGKNSKRYAAPLPVPRRC